MLEWPEDHAQTLTARTFDLVVVKVEAEAVVVVVSTTIEAAGAAAAEDVVEQGGRFGDLVAAGLVKCQVD
jgi:hypothetical protein